MSSPRPDPMAAGPHSPNIVNVIPVTNFGSRPTLPPIVRGRGSQESVDENPIGTRGASQFFDAMNEGSGLSFSDPFAAPSAAGSVTSTRPIVSLVGGVEGSRNPVGVSSTGSVVDNSHTRGKSLDRTRNTAASASSPAAAAVTEGDRDALDGGAAVRDGVAATESFRKRKKDPVVRVNDVDEKEADTMDSPKSALRGNKERRGPRNLHKGKESTSLTPISLSKDQSVDETRNASSADNTIGTATGLRTNDTEGGAKDAGKHAASRATASRQSLSHIYTTPADGSRLLSPRGPMSYGRAQPLVDDGPRGFFRAIRRYSDQYVPEQDRVPHKQQLASSGTAASSMNDSDDAKRKPANTLLSMLLMRSWSALTGSVEYDDKPEVPMNKVAANGPFRSKDPACKDVRTAYFPLYPGVLKYETQVENERAQEQPPKKSSELPLGGQFRDTSLQNPCYGIAIITSLLCIFFIAIFAVYINGLKSPLTSKTVTSYLSVVSDLSYSIAYEQMAAAHVCSVIFKRVVDGTTLNATFLALFRDAVEHFTTQQGKTDLAIQDTILKFTEEYDTLGKLSLSGKQWDIVDVEYLQHTRMQTTAGMECKGVMERYERISLLLQLYMSALRQFIVSVSHASGFVLIAPIFSSESNAAFQTSIMYIRLIRTAVVGTGDPAMYLYSPLSKELTKCAWKIESWVAGVEEYFRFGADPTSDFFSAISVRSPFSQSFVATTSPYMHLQIPPSFDVLTSSLAVSSVKTEPFAWNATLGNAMLDSGAELIRLSFVKINSATFLKNKSTPEYLTARLTCAIIIILTLSPALLGQLIGVAVYRFHLSVHNFVNERARAARRAVHRMHYTVSRLLHLDVEQLDQRLFSALANTPRGQIPRAELQLHEYIVASSKVSEYLPDTVRFPPLGAPREALIRGQIFAGPALFTRRKLVAIHVTYQMGDVIRGISSSHRGTKMSVKSSHFGSFMSTSLRTPLYTTPARNTLGYASRGPRVAGVDNSVERPMSRSGMSYQSTPSSGGGAPGSSHTYGGGLNLKWSRSSGSLSTSAVSTSSHPLPGAEAAMDLCASAHLHAKQILGFLETAVNESMPHSTTGGVIEHYGSYTIAWINLCDDILFPNTIAISAVASLQEQCANNGVLQPHILICCADATVGNVSSRTHYPVATEAPDDSVGIGQPSPLLRRTTKPVNAKVGPRRKSLEEEFDLATCELINNHITLTNETVHELARNRDSLGAHGRAATPAAEGGKSHHRHHHDHRTHHSNHPHPHRSHAEKSSRTYRDPHVSAQGLQSPAVTPRRAKSAHAQRSFPWRQGTSVGKPSKPQRAQSSTAPEESKAVRGEAAKSDELEAREKNGERSTQTQPSTCEKEEDAVQRASSKMLSSLTTFNVFGDMVRQLQMLDDIRRMQRVQLLINCEAVEQFVIERAAFHELISTDEVMKYTDLNRTPPHDKAGRFRAMSTLLPDELSEAAQEASLQTSTIGTKQEPAKPTSAPKAKTAFPHTDSSEVTADHAVSATSMQTLSIGNNVASKTAKSTDAGTTRRDPRLSLGSEEDLESDDVDQELFDWIERDIAAMEARNTPEECNDWMTKGTGAFSSDAKGTPRHQRMTRWLELRQRGLHLRHGSVAEVNPPVNTSDSLRQAVTQLKLRLHALEVKFIPIDVLEIRCDVGDVNMAQTKEQTETGGSNTTKRSRKPNARQDGEESERSSAVYQWRNETVWPVGQAEDEGATTQLPAVFTGQNKKTENARLWPEKLTDANLWSPSKQNRDGEKGMQGTYVDTATGKRMPLRSAVEEAKQANRGSPPQSVFGQADPAFSSEDIRKLKKTFVRVRNGVFEHEIVPCFTFSWSAPLTSTSGSKAGGSTGAIDGRGLSSRKSGAASFGRSRLSLASAEVVPTAALLGANSTARRAPFWGTPQLSTSLKDISTTEENSTSLFSDPAMFTVPMYGKNGEGDRAQSYRVTGGTPIFFSDAMRVVVTKNRDQVNTTPIAVTSNSSSITQRNARTAETNVPSALNSPGVNDHSPLERNARGNPAALSTSMKLDIGASQRGAQYEHDVITAWRNLFDRYVTVLASNSSSMFDLREKIGEVEMDLELFNREYGETTMALFPSNRIRAALQMLRTTGEAPLSQRALRIMRVHSGLSF